MLPAELLVQIIYYISDKDTGDNLLLADPGLAQMITPYLIRGLIKEKMPLLIEPFNKYSKGKDILQILQPDYLIKYFKGIQLYDDLHKLSERRTIEINTMMSDLFIDYLNSPLFLGTPKKNQIRSLLSVYFDGKMYTMTIHISNPLKVEIRTTQSLSYMYHSYVKFKISENDLFYLLFITLINMDIGSFDIFNKY